MALADTARLAVSLDLQGNFASNLAKNQRSLKGFDSQVSGTGTRAYRAGTQIGTGIKTGALIAAGAIGFLATNVGLGLRSLSELETVVTQSSAVLKSTKGVAGQTAESIRNLAEKYEGLNATIDDKVIQSAENVLLTFTAIRKQAFEPAIKAALDMSTALGTDLQGSVIQIGKALQDPIKGITALRRVGVNFSADQIKVIKKLVESNDLLGAQKVILKELNTEFGGSFLAGGNTTAGKVAKFKDAIEDLQKALATALLPVIGKISDALSKFLADPKVMRAVSELGQNIAGLFSDANLARGADFLKGAFETAKTAAPIVAAAAKASFGFIQSAVALFKQLPAPLQGLLVGGFALNKLTGGLVTNITGGLIDLLNKSRGSSPGNPVFVSDIGGLGGAGGKAGLLGQLSSLVMKVAVVGMAAEVADLIHGVISPGGGLEGRTQSGQLLPGDQLAWPFGPKNTPHINIGPFHDILGGDSTFSVPLPTALAGAITTNGQPPIGAPPAPGRRLSSDGSDARGMGATLAHTVTAASREAAGRIKDDIRGLGALITKARSAEFLKLAAALAHPKSPAAMIKAADGITKLIGQGRGGAEQTAHVLASLRKQLANTHDPKLASALRRDIAKVAGLLPGRQYAAAQLSAVNGMLRDGKVSKSELAKIKGIEQALKDRGLPHAADVIKQRVAQAQRAQVAAADRTAAAIRNKDLNVTFNTQNNAYLNGRLVASNLVRYTSSRGNS